LYTFCVFGAIESVSKRFASISRRPKYVPDTGRTLLLPAVLPFGIPAF
jgi:hypothetical protein